MTVDTAPAPVTPAVELDIRPLTVRIGAEISGVRIDGDLDAATVAAVRTAIVRNRVVFFRDQHHLTPEIQIAFARLLGELTQAHPSQAPLDGYPLVHELDASKGGRAGAWHTDVSFTDRPPAFSVLRAVEIPPVGGDTIWANTVAAYWDLPAPLQQVADALRVYHTNQHDYGLRLQDLDGLPEVFKERFFEFRSKEFEAEHPVVRVHPETGEPSLLLGGFVKQLTGVSQEQSFDLLRTFADAVAKPENTVRWHWRTGDVAIWDNRATQHYAINDYADSPRIVHRVTVAGTIPVGRDGRPSVSRAGDASEYSPIGTVPTPAV
ncbi:TauD/TfdA family dioxygenase [Frankia sp. AgB1.9]|uniref:TauD/TfdA dioxygenase family protein n=1 Tax=unclassified Frankia TaxID=2632575 RepID=UPI00193129AD|nr:MULTISPECIES: TauD/TfdA family dioxygenase [unclassified Frankia]MBL7492897.1 TauD/TfdA family dioxygenase [Frankia sp. AgW1.1]MBL7551246.1 TauD/TfdA family dioxygenase [Frankia sp. AgB1.9]MBL7622782.1 TauD/TfdA family dioxygenase [Frankia sp. AgB1.8]